MHQQDKESDSNSHLSTLQAKKTMYLTQIRRTALLKELRSRRADHNMIEEDLKDDMKYDIAKSIDELLIPYKNADEFRLKSCEIWQLLESAADSLYFNRIVEEKRFLYCLMNFLKEMHTDKLYLKPKYEECIDVCLWFFCNALKFGTDLLIFNDKENFDLVYDIVIQVVSAKCLTTYANLLANYIVCVADEALAHKLIEVDKVYFPNVAKRIEEVMNDIKIMDREAKNFIDSAIFLFTQAGAHLNYKIDTLDVNL